MPATDPIAAAFALLGLPNTATMGEIRGSYRFLARTRHPDAGGTATGFYELHTAYLAAVAFAETATCEDCDGSGRKKIVAGWSSTLIFCPTCQGSGKYHNDQR